MLLSFVSKHGTVGLVNKLHVLSIPSEKLETAFEQNAEICNIQYIGVPLCKLPKTKRGADFNRQALQPWGF